MIPGDRQTLFEQGTVRLGEFCGANELTAPEIRSVHKGKWQFDSTCAYYRPTYIAICLERCAHRGYGGRQWSWPGYVVDRTPFGVLQHELGHHVDVVMSGLKHGYQGNFSKALRRLSGEEPITTYCPNDAEWFAEIFRLFVTNPDLLEKLRPKAFGVLFTQFKVVEYRSWRKVLDGAQERYFNAAQRKIDKYYEV